MDIANNQAKVEKSWLPSNRLLPQFIGDADTSNLESAPYFRFFNVSTYDEGKGGNLHCNQLTLTVPKGFLTDKAMQTKYGITIENFVKVTGAANGQFLFEDIEPIKDKSTKGVNIIIDGKPLVSDVAAYIDNSHTMAPLKAIADAFGFETKWDGKEGKITLTNATKTIIMYINKADFTINGESEKFVDIVPKIKDGRTFLPLAKLAEFLHIAVSWDGSTSTSVLTSK